MCAQYGNCTRGRRSVPGIRHGVTDIRHVATGICRDPTSIHKDSTHDAMRHGCYLYCHTRVLHVFLLFPLNASRSLPSSPILPVLQPSEHSDLLRHTAARHWDSTVTNTETQTKLGRVEFRFLSQWKTGWGGAIQNPPLAPPTCKPLAIIP